MIAWWGPIIGEYYGATEGMGFTFCDSARMARAQGHGRQDAVRRTAFLDENMREVPTGQTGKLWFKTASPFEYFNDPQKTARGATRPTGR